MLAAFRTEWVKQWRRPRTYAVLSLTVLVPIIIAIALKANPPSASPERDQQFFYWATTTGVVLPVAALRVMSRFLLVIVVALFAGDAISAEAGWGNLRAILVRPIKRRTLLSAKLATTALIALIATILIPLTGLIAGVIAFGWHPLNIAFISQSPHEIIGNLSLATIYVFWSLTSVVAFGFMFSTITDSASGAVFAGFGLYVVSSILDGITSIPHVVRDAMPTHYIDSWTDLFTRHGATSDMIRGAIQPVGYVLAFCLVAWWWFQRKDVLS
jgi:ABC-2 type transport system permease protein